MNKVLVCLDGSNLSKAVCDYGIDIAKKLNLPLVLLNVIEHSHISKKVNLSGNIGLGSKDDLLEELANEEMNESKQLILKGKAVLKEMEKYVKSQNLTNYTTLQKHGTLYETLDELSSDLRIAIIGLKGESNSNIGSHIEELLRTLNIPILLVNKEFTPIKSILIAYETASLNGDSVEAILTYQKENNIDIIAMGAYSHNRFRSAIFGSFTTKMLLNSKVPLLLFR